MLQIFLAAPHTLRPDIVLREVVNEVMPLDGGSINHNQPLLYANRSQNRHLCQQLTDILGIGNFDLPATARTQQFINPARANSLSRAHNTDAPANLPDPHPLITCTKHALLHHTPLPSPFAHS